MLITMVTREPAVSPDPGTLRNLYIAIALFGVGAGGVHPLIALALSDANFGALSIGTVSSAYFTGGLVASITASVLIRHSGHVRAFCAAAGLAALTTGALDFAQSVPTWALLRFLTGYGLGWYYLVVESWINHQSQDHNRGRRLAMYESVRIVGYAAGPLLINVTPPGWPFSLVGGLFLAAIIPVALGRSNRPSVERQTTGGRQQLSRSSLLGLAACFASGLLASSFYGLGAIFGERAGWSAGQISVFMSFVILSPVVCQIPLGAFADRRGRPGALALGAIVSGLAAIGMAIGKPDALWLAIVLGGVTYGFSHPFYVLGLGLASDAAGPQHVLKVGAAMLIAYHLGTVFGPLLGSVALDFLGGPGLYVWFLAPIGMIGLLAGVQIVCSARR